MASGRKWGGRVEEEGNEGGSVPVLVLVLLLLLISTMTLCRDFFCDLIFFF